MPDHHDGIIRDRLPQTLGVIQLLKPAQRFGGQSGDRERQELMQL